jgi:hypothetical protein
MTIISRVVLLLCLSSFLVAEPTVVGEPGSGYRGIWYANQATKDEYVYKYSGGLGTYCAKHIPIAVYAPEVEKTFFVYGGTKDGYQKLTEMVGAYDHRSKQVARPVILMDKGTADAHDNPVISLDKEGHIWVFASAHGTARPAYVMRSQKPHDIQSFEVVKEFNFSYPQIWYGADKGFLFLHTYYKGGRGLNWMRSEYGEAWTERMLLAHMEEGHYQISWPYHGKDAVSFKKVGTAFNYHPTAFQGHAEMKGLNWRTNLYYIETDDYGHTWRTVQGEVVDAPLTDPKSAALIHDYEAEGRLVYLKDLKYDKKGRPVVLYVTSNGWQPGPKTGPRQFEIAHWTGKEWRRSVVAATDNNYDTGGLHIEGKKWWIVAPTNVGPQPFNPGGEMARWKSVDKGQTWEKVQTLTSGSPYNHGYARRPLGGHPGFAALWADGHGRKPSPSRLYFYDAERDEVYRLPEAMDTDWSAPERVALEEK